MIQDNVFADLIPGLSYTIEAPKTATKKKWFREDSFCHLVHHALLASRATYESDPLSFLNEDVAQHTFSKIVASMNCNRKWLNCYTDPRPDSKYPHRGLPDLYIAFRGTQSREDIWTDVSVAQTMKGGGWVHQGFLSRSEEIPIEPFLDLLKVEGFSLSLSPSSSFPGLKKVNFTEKK